MPKAFPRAVGAFLANEEDDQADSNGDQDERANANAESKRKSSIVRRRSLLYRRARIARREESCLTGGEILTCGQRDANNGARDVSRELPSLWDAVGLTNERTIRRRRAGRKQSGTKGRRVAACLLFEERGAAVIVNGRSEE